MIYHALWQHPAFPWILANVLLIHTHYFGGFVFVAQGFHALFFLRGRVRIGAFVALFITGILFAPWFFSVTVRQFAQDEVCVNCAPPDNWQELQQFPARWFGQMWALMGLLALAGLGYVKSAAQRAGLRPAPTLSPTPPNTVGEQSIAPYHAPISTHGVNTPPPRWRGGGWGVGLNYLLLALIFIPTGTIYLLGHTEVIFFAHRLTQITIPLMLLLALGVGNMQANARWVVVIALVLYGITTVDWYRIKVPWHDVTQLAAEYIEPDALVLAEVGPEESALQYYLDHLLTAGVQTTAYPFWEDLDRYTYYEEQIPALIAEQSTRQMGDVKTAWVIYFSKDEGFFRHLGIAGYLRTMTRTLQHTDDAQIQVYRYDLLPEGEQMQYANGMILRAMEFQPDDLRVDLWWQTEATLTADYVVSAFLMDESGAVVAQYDSIPANRERPTLSWQPGEVIYDPHVLILNEGIPTLPAGDYTVGVKVYGFAPDGTIQVYLTKAGAEFFMWAVE